MQVYHLFSESTLGYVCTWKQLVQIALLMSLNISGFLALEGITYHINLYLSWVDGLTTISIML